MTLHKHTADFPADTRWMQLPGSAIAVTSDGRVYRVAAGVVEELQAESTRMKATTDGSLVESVDTAALKAAE